MHINPGASPLPRIQDMITYQVCLQWPWAMMVNQRCILGRYPGGGVLFADFEPIASIEGKNGTRVEQMPTSI